MKEVLGTISPQAMNSNKKLCMSCTNLCLGGMGWDVYSSKTQIFAFYRQLSPLFLVCDAANIAKIMSPIQYRHGTIIFFYWIFNSRASITGIKFLLMLCEVIRKWYYWNAVGLGSKLLPCTYFCTIHFVHYFLNLYLGIWQIVMS